MLPAVPNHSQPHTDPTQAHVVALRHKHDNLYEVDIYSPALQETITNNLLLPREDTPRPTLYLMQGSDGGQTGSTWPVNTKYEEFFADKHVQVISPIGGRRTFFTDWKSTGPDGPNTYWKTYFTKELPIVMERDFKGNGRAAIAGLSMSGVGALNAAIAAPEQYQAVAALSTYPSTTSLLGRLVQTLVVADGGGQVQNLWGWWDDPAWLRNDPYAQTERLRGIKVYTSTGNGLVRNFAGFSFETVKEAIGEWGARLMTDPWVNDARAKGVEVHYDREGYGIHNWDFFEEHLYKAWHTTLGPALGA